MSERVQGNAASQQSEQQSHMENVQHKGFETQASWVAGIDIGGTKVLMLLSNPKSGEEVYERRLSTQSADQPERFFEWLFAELNMFCEEMGCHWNQLAGVGLGFGCHFTR